MERAGGKAAGNDGFITRQRIGLVYGSSPRRHTGNLHFVNLDSVSTHLM
jgi:hypothetical protein